MKNAVSVCSGFAVGAALRTSGSAIYTGCNIENPSLMLSECAEKIAIMKAVSEGADDIEAIAVVSKSNEYCYPCGSCRQVIYEFARNAAIFVRSGKDIRRYTIDDLLPYAFSR